MPKRIAYLIVSLILCCGTVHGQDKRHFYQDKKWWVGEVVIGASWLASGIAVNHTRSGATHLFGNQTTSAKVAGFELAAFGAYTGLHYLSWRWGHNDPAKGWRVFSYTAIPAISVSFGAATAVDALNSTPSARAIPQVHCPRGLTCLTR